MAVDGVSLAASIAGLLSLGLQITGGIIKYLDAFKDREDELAYLKQQNDALTTTLLAVDTTTSSFQGQHSKFTSAVIQNIQSCKKELGAVEALRVNLADCGKSSWVTGLKNKKKKLTYAFHRPKIQQLAHRLQEANEALQLTLNGLELEISWSNTNKLTAIQSSSQTHTSELVLLRSKVEVVEAPITSIHNRLPLLQDSVESTAQLVGGITNEIQASSQAIQQGLQQSHDLIQIQFRQQQERLGKLEGLLEKLQPQDERNQPKHTLAARVASKPAALKELCDGILAPNKRHDRDIPLDQAACESQNRVASPLHNSQYTSNTNTICICCHRPHRLTSRTEIHLGHVYLYSEWESKGHWPGCPLSKTARKSRRAFNLKYTGLIRMVELAIGASFMWTSGAGGFSISPNFTYYPTVDRTSDPAFRIMSMMGYSWAYCLTKNKKPFMVACLRKLVKLFDDKKACPLAVDNWNHSLMREAADAVRYLFFGMAY
ncbi:hypothetical protein M426DRAFT_151661 [Hypoxylon sp. CI-4A]|nr:hypothetical protein M426DRAFT_151661 [Hypoxylon sp. CI-4A]